jgi:hypothetical protein
MPPLDEPACGATAGGQVAEPWHGLSQKRLALANNINGRNRGVFVISVIMAL